MVRWSNGRPAHPSPRRSLIIKASILLNVLIIHPSSPRCWQTRNLRAENNRSIKNKHLRRWILIGREAIDAFVKCRKHTYFITLRINNKYKCSLSVNGLFVTLQLLLALYYGQFTIAHNLSWTGVLFFRLWWKSHIFYGTEGGAFQEKCRLLNRLCNIYFLLTLLIYKVNMESN